MEQEGDVLRIEVGGWRRGQFANPVLGGVEASVSGKR